MISVLKKKKDLSFIDLFAGIGGFRYAIEGIDTLNGRCLFSSEMDKFCQKTYHANYGEFPQGNITHTKVLHKIPDQFDLLTGGFPCQAFSLAGKRKGFEDKRGVLFAAICAIVECKQPKAIFLENVKGLLSHNGGRTMEVIEHFITEELNYYMPPPQLINAKNFGLPQNRERVFIVAFRKDLVKKKKEFAFPKPNTSIQNSIADILEDEEVSVKYYLSDTYLQTLENHRARHAKKGNGFGYQVLRNDQIANAIVIGGMGLERNLVVDRRLRDFTPITRIKGQVNRNGIRRMTPREWARLQGFSDDFIIPVSDQQAYKQFANSVPIPAVQETVKKICAYLSL